MSRKIAVVTGGNKGIGYACVKGLAALPNMHVIMTSRNEERGKKALSTLLGTDTKDSSSEISMEILDVASTESIESFAKEMLQKHGRVDILVNNAGILPDWKQPFMQSSLKQVMEVMQVNTFGPYSLIKAFLPSMIKQGYGRIVNMSSGLGQLSDMGGEFTGYRLSKCSLNALTKIVQAEVGPDKDILVNTMCPGFVKTDMTGGENSPAPRTPDQGADTAIWLATLPKGGFRGTYFRDREPIPW